MTIFRYADRENAFWTGYFTSRPALKGYVRTMSGYYLVRSSGLFTLLPSILVGVNVLVGCNSLYKFRQQGNWNSLREGVVQGQTQMHWLML